MSTKDFTAIAKILHKYRIGGRPSSMRLLQDLASYFKSTNPKFDKDKFIKQVLGQ